jgi:hypothetical protein
VSVFSFPTTRLSFSAPSPTTSVVLASRYVVLAPLFDHLLIFSFFSFSPFPALHNRFPASPNPVPPSHPQRLYPLEHSISRLSLLLLREPLTRPNGSRRPRSRHLRQAEPEWSTLRRRMLCRFFLVDFILSSSVSFSFLFLLRLFLFDSPFPSLLPGHSSVLLTHLAVQLFRSDRLDLAHLDRNGKVRLPGLLLGATRERRLMFPPVDSGLINWASFIFTVRSTSSLCTRNKNAD